MNKTERDALREKHREVEMPHPYYRGCAVCIVQTFTDYVQLIPAGYPCDVIKVLDALDRETRRADGLGDLLAKAEEELETDPCDHYWLTKAGSRDASVEVCARCGTEREKCDHLDYAYVPNEDSPAFGDGYVGVDFIYCPKCGEKL